MTVILFYGFLITLGSFLSYWRHVDYGEIYDYIKSNPDYREIFAISTKKDLLGAVIIHEVKMIFVYSLLMFFISKTLLLISIGSLLTYIAYKIPSLQKALNE